MKKKDSSYPPSRSSSSSSTDLGSDSESDFSSGGGHSDGSKVQSAKSDKKWKDYFIVTRSIYKHAKKGRGSAKCDVAKFERGIDILIVNRLI